MTPGSEVATRPGSQELMEQLDIRFSDPQELAVKIAHRLALAATPEELFDTGGTFGWKEQAGTPFLVKRVYWLPSRHQEGLGFYALVEAVNVDTGEPAVLTTGASNVCVQLARAEREGWLDRPLKLEVNPEPTGAGFYPHSLKLA